MKVVKNLVLKLHVALFSVQYGCQFQCEALSLHPHPDKPKATILPPIFQSFIHILSTFLAK